MFEIILIQFQQIDAAGVIFNPECILVGYEIIEFVCKFTDKSPYAFTSLEMPVMGRTHSLSLTASVVI